VLKAESAVTREDECQAVSSLLTENPGGFLKLPGFFRFWPDEDPRLLWGAVVAEDLQDRDQNTVADAAVSLQTGRALLCLRAGSPSLVTPLAMRARPASSPFWARRGIPASSG